MFSSSPQACRRAAFSLIASALVWLAVIAPTAGAAGPTDNHCTVDLACPTTTQATETPPTVPEEPEETPSTTAAAIVYETTTSAYRSPTTESRSQAPATTEAPTTTEPGPTTTARDLLVAGDGSQGAESTTTSAGASVVKASEAAAGGLSETTAVWAIVGGLVAVALGIGWWTWRFWRRTSPGPSTTAEANARAEQGRRRGPDTRIAPIAASATGNGAAKKAVPRRVVAKKAAPGRGVATKAAPRASARKAAPRVAVKKAAPRRPGGPIDGDGSPAFRSSRR